MSCHGSCQTRWDCLLAHTHQTKGCLLLSGFCELLLTFHSWLLQHHLPTHWPHQKEPCLVLEPHLPRCFWPPKTAIPITSYALSPQPYCTICHHHWCFQICLGHYPSLNWHQWRVAFLLLSIPILLSCRTELQHLWLRTPCCHPGPQDLAPLPSWISLSSPSFHGSQELTYFQQPRHWTDAKQAGCWTSLTLISKLSMFLGNYLQDPMPFPNVPTSYPQPPLTMMMSPCFPLLSLSVSLTSLCPSVSALHLKVIPWFSMDYNPWMNPPLLPYVLICLIGSLRKTSSVIGDMSTYLDDALHHSILARCHDHEMAGYPGYLKTQ